MNEVTENTAPDTPRRRILKGHVVSDKMDSTIVVEVNRRRPHPLYEKILRRKKKYLVHDGREEAGIGDFVEIEETRPLSKRKCWRLLRILEKAR